MRPRSFSANMAQALLLVYAAQRFGDRDLLLGDPAVGLLAVERPAGDGGVDARGAGRAGRRPSRSRTPARAPASSSERKAYVAFDALGPILLSAQRPSSMT